MASIRCAHCGAFNYIPLTQQEADQLNGGKTDPVEIPPDVIEKSDRLARAYGFEIGKGQAIVPMLDVSPDNPFMDPEWKDRYLREPLQNPAINES